MKIPQSGLRIDNPAFPLLQANISYWGITTANGNPGGTTLVDANLANEPNYVGLLIKILDGGAAGQVRQVASHIGNTITVAVAWTNPAGALQQIAAGTRFVILSGSGGGGGFGLGAGILTTYGQEAIAPTNANGVTWVDLLDRTVIAKPTELWGITLTIAGGWAGLCQLRFVEAIGGTKIFPFAAQAVEGTDFVSAIYWAFPAPVVVPIASGYKVQFRSTNAGDVAGGRTCALTELAKIEIG